MITRRHSLLFAFLLVIAGFYTHDVLPQTPRTRLNQAPIASAGPDQTVAAGSVVTLNGSGSTDADGDPLSYAWRFVSRPLGSLAVLENQTDLMPSFKMDVPGAYVVRLVVNDGFVDSLADTVTISRTNSRPLANAGRDQTIAAGTTVRLDGSGSSDMDGDRLQFAWSFVTRPEGSAAVLTNPTAVAPAFVADVPGRYTIRLSVSDAVAFSLFDTVTISTTNSAPVADAGPDQTVSIGRSVSLSGSGSTDADGDSLSYSWSLLSRPTGSAARLSDSAAVLPMFVADRAGTYVLQLIVNDGNNTSAPDTMIVTTRNSTPVAKAGSGQSAALGGLVLLDGSDSFDADGDVLTYSWAITSRPAGSAATIAGPLSPRPSFVVDRAGSYVVQLIVTDGKTKSAPATLTISTQNSPPAARASSDRLSVQGDEEVTLIGDLSSDPDGDPLTYAWSIIARPAGSRALLSAANVSRPAFTPDVAGDYVVQLVVNDGNASSEPGTALIKKHLFTKDVTVTASDPTASEAGPDPGAFTFTRTAPSTQENTTVAVAYVVGGTATNGTDYTPSLTGTVIIPAGQDSVTVTITPVDDTDVEGNETVTVAIKDKVSGVATVTIADNDGNELPTVTVATTDAAASETGPDAGSFTFTRTGPTGAALDVSYSIGGTAANGTDYTPTLSGTVTIPIGQPSIDITITPLVDSFVENPETVVLTVQPGASYAAGAPNSGTVTIADDPAVVTVAATDANAAEAGADTGTFTFTRTGGNIAGALTVNYSIAGSAGNGSDYQLITGSITIPATEPSALRTITPLPDNIVESPETVVVTILGSSEYVVGAAAAGTVTIADDPAVVSVSATDPNASETGPDTGTFTFTRSGGDLTSPLQVSFSRSGTATEGQDYVNLGSSIVTIAANEVLATRTVTPIVDTQVEPDETVIVTIDPSASYTIGASPTATVTIHDLSNTPLVSVVAQDSAASEVGPNVGVFRFTRTGSTTSPLTVNYTVGGTAVNGTDYVAINTSIVISAGQASVDRIITPIVDTLSEPTETVVLTVTDDAAYDVGSPASATVNIADSGSTCGPEGGPLTNGATHCGAISNASETDTWTFTANAGDHIAVHIGEVIDNNDFRPWIRVQAPNGTTIGSNYGTDATAVDVVGAATGTYQVLVASYDSLFDGTGTYLITMAHTPGPITISPGDQGGPLTNGGMHTGEIFQGDLDVWTFTAAAGDHIAVHIGEISDANDFRPWIRIWAPNGSQLGGNYGVDASALDVIAPVAGNYLVLVASYDSGYDGAGTYRLTMTHTPGPITVSPGDQGGPLTNGAMHTGEIVRGDLDVWTFTATAGDHIAVHIGQITDNDDFRPWIRIWAPNGAQLGGNYGTDATALDVIANLTGDYLVLVASYDSVYDGSGTYRLTMTHTPGPITVSTGDQGGPLTNGAMHTGEIIQGDLDVWTFTATAGDHIAVHIGEITDVDDFRPWIRIWAPNGAQLGGNYGIDASALDVIANVTGNYLVLVGSYDSGYDGEGTYRITMAHTPGPITVSPGDQGGPMTNGAMHTGEIIKGDLDVWTFTATAGDRIDVHIGEITDNDDFRPWIRIWAPNGAQLGGNYGTDATALEVVANLTGNYLVLVGSYDSVYDGTGTYRITLGKTGAPVTVSAGDEGGPFSSSASGQIVQGDLDLWAFTAVAGETITLQINQTAETDDFRPWIRIWAPNGASLGGTYGLDTATLRIVMPVSGTFLVPVGSYDSGYDGTGSYSLSLTHN